MCTTTPATKFSPTLVTATAGSTPAFCTKRVFRAMPPSPAGASLLANADATCARNVGIDGSRWLTEPITASVAPTNVNDRRRPSPARTTPTARRPTWSAMSLTLPNCGIRKYVASAERRDREELAAAEALELRERRRRLHAVRLDLGAQLVEQLAVVLERRRASHRRARPGCSSGSAEADRRRCRARRTAESTVRCAPDREAEGDEQLGHVGGQRSLARGDLGEPEVDQPRQRRRRRR